MRISPMLVAIVTTGFLACSAIAASWIAKSSSFITIFLRKLIPTQGWGSGSVSQKFVGATLCGCPFGGQARKPAPTSMRRLNDTDPLPSMEFGSPLRYGYGQFDYLRKEPLCRATKNLRES